jgi:hypothetical protein
MDQYTEAGLPQPESSRGYTRREVEQLLRARLVEVPRDTQFRLLDDDVCGRERRVVDCAGTGLTHRRWNADQFLTLEAACRLLSAGFSRSTIQRAIAGVISWDDLKTERDRRLRHLVGADLDIDRLRNRIDSEQP